MQPFGLVFAGGGTKGAYQAGVWKALDEMKIPLCAVTGTSIGAINGAVFAQGSADMAYKIWNNMAPDMVLNTDLCFEGATSLFDPTHLIPLLSEILTKNGLDISPLRELLLKIVDEKLLRESKIDYGLATFSLSDFKPMEIFIDDIPEGKLVDYILASACFPGFKSAKIEDKAFIDGGFSNNMPVSMLIEKGIKDIIAVDVGGMGLVKGYNCEGLNLILISPGNSLGNILDFDSSVIERNMNIGYYDTLRVFGRASGSIYYFAPREYDKLHMRFSDDVIKGLEEAAFFYGMKLDMIYSAKTFLDSLFSMQSGIYAKYEKVRNSFVNKRVIRDIALKKLDIEPGIRIPLICDALEGNIANKIIKTLLPKEYQAANALLVMKRIYGSQ